MLPMDLVFVRHGESEENLADKMARRGDTSFFTPEFRNRHSRTYRLTDNGVAQSKAAGEWLRKNIPVPFGCFYVSDFIRAKETAAHLGLPNAQWRVRYDLRERDQSFMNNSPNHGHGQLLPELEQYRFGFDRFLSYPAGGGESIANLCLRLKTGFFGELKSECHGKIVIAVCHGHVMRAARLIVEDLGHDDFVRLDSSTNPADRILNCQILWYTRRNPNTLQEESAEFVAVRSVCASGLVGDYGWRRIGRNLRPSEDLLAEAERYPRQFNG